MQLTYDDIAVLVHPTSRNLNVPADTGAYSIRNSTMYPPVPNKLDIKDQVSVVFLYWSTFPVETETGFIGVPRNGDILEVGGHCIMVPFLDNIAAGAKAIFEVEPVFQGIGMTYIRRAKGWNYHQYGSEGQPTVHRQQLQIVLRLPNAGE